MATDTDPPGAFISYPFQRVVGTIADAQDARTAIEALLHQGFQRSDIDVLRGEQGLHRLDPSGSEHGFFAQFQRTLLRTLGPVEEFKSLLRSVSAIWTPGAEEFIVDWASDLRMDKPWALVVHLDRPAGRADEAAALREAIHEYFGQRVVASTRRLRALFRRGRISLVIALAFLTASSALSDALAAYLGESRLGGVIREGFLISFRFESLRFHSESPGRCPQQYH